MSSDAIAILVAAGVVAVLYIAHQAIKKINLFLSHVRKISRLCSIVEDNKDSIGNTVKSLQEVYDGANKINQDAVDANIALVNEVVKLRESIDKFVGAMVPPSVEIPSMDPEIMEYRVMSTIKDLEEQGLDPEDAKRKAAEIELEYMANLGQGAFPADYGFGIGA